MVHDGHGLHHAHKRKRVHKKLEKYPNPNKWKRVLDHLIYGVGFFAPAVTFPQLLKIWVEKNASGISIVSWIGYLIAAIFWMLYGIIHKEKPIIFTYAIWIVLDILIIVGTIIYG